MVTLLPISQFAPDGDAAADDGVGPDAGAVADLRAGADHDARRERHIARRCSAVGSIAVCCDQRDQAGVADRTAAPRRRRRAVPRRREP